MKKPAATIGKKLFLSHFLAVLLVSGSIGTYFYHSAYSSLKRNLQGRLENSAALISRTIDAKEIEILRAPEDAQLPVYSRYLSKMRDLRGTNPDIAYLYVMRRDGDRVFFVIDTDTSEQQACPGQPYLDIVAALMKGFEAPSVDDQIVHDPWGAFMSGYAPIVNGKGRFLVGMDMRADEVEKKFRALKISGAVSLVCSLLLAYLFSRVLSRHFIAGIRLLIERCQAIADGRLGEELTFRSDDELAQLVAAFNRMSAHLAQSRQETRRAEIALTEANEALEIRVRERTEELAVVNEQLKGEIAERRKIQQALIEAARTDPLTGLLNRRAIQEHLAYQVVAYQRNREPFTVLLADIDQFKAINDRFGHHAGDEALRNLTRLIQGQIRQQDLVARWGGEEFLILLPDTDLQGGKRLACKLRQQVAESEGLLPEQPSLRLTISIGVSQFQESATLDKCIQAADDALYRAKSQGRDLVVTAEEG
ncbi:MAG: diguanylate cyclase [Deltaproteobacteria bacterium]|nr:diguanylate cyclase [Deltaproteobacteria bacterium]